MQRNSLGPLILKLLGRGIQYQYLKFTGRPAKPHALSLEITHKCVAHCTMCNIWRIPRNVPDLPLDQWVRLLSSPLLRDLRELDITGGEPFLRKDLVNLFETILDLKEDTLPQLRSVAITTNGFLTDEIVKVTGEIARSFGEKHLGLVIACALDAVGEKHDRIRGFKDAWSKVDKTIRKLKNIEDAYPNLVLGLKSTVLPINVPELHRIARYADENGLFTIISPCIITENRYDNVDQRQELAFSREDLNEMIGFFESDRFQWSYHRDALVHYLETGYMKKPCSAGFNYLFVRYNGDVYPCPLIRISLGNIKDNSIEDLFVSKDANRFRRHVGKYPECRVCTEPGLERYALPFEGLTYLRFLLKLGRRDFLNLHRHMGLDKYF